VQFGGKVAPTLMVFAWPAYTLRDTTRLFGVNPGNGSPANAGAPVDAIIAIAATAAISREYGRRARLANICKQIKVSIFPPAKILKG
jgi:hypothetical protein